MSDLELLAISLDEVGLWSTILAASDMSSLGTGSGNLPTTIPTGLLAFWPLDNGLLCVAWLSIIRLFFSWHVHNSGLANSRPIWDSSDRWRALAEHSWCGLSAVRQECG